MSIFRDFGVYIVEDDISAEEIDLDNTAELYRRYAAGDDECFEGVVAEYFEGLVLYLYGFLGIYQDAEDIVQDIFSYLAIKKPPFEGENGFKTWLYRIAANRAKNHLRSQRKVVLTELTEECAASEECDPEVLLMQTLENRNLYRAMRSLNREYYQALYLRYFEELSVPQIARAMHKNIKQINNYLQRGRESLRKKMEEADNENV